MESKGDRKYFEKVMDNALACIKFLAFLISCFFYYTCSLFRKQSLLAFKLYKYRTQTVEKHNNELHAELKNTKSQLSLPEDKLSNKGSEFTNILKNSDMLLHKKHGDRSENITPLDFPIWGSQVLKYQRDFLDKARTCATFQNQGATGKRERPSELAKHMSESKTATNALTNEEKVTSEHVHENDNNIKASESNKLLELQFNTEGHPEEAQEGLRLAENETQLLQEQANFATQENRNVHEQILELKQKIFLLNAHLESVTKERDTYERLLQQGVCSSKQQLLIEVFQEKKPVPGVSPVIEEERERGRYCVEDNAHQPDINYQMIPTHESESDATLCSNLMDYDLTSVSENDKERSFETVASGKMCTEVKKFEGCLNVMKTSEGKAAQNPGTEFVCEVKSEYDRQYERCIDYNHPPKRTKWTNSMCSSPCGSQGSPRGESVNESEETWDDASSSSSQRPNMLALGSKANVFGELTDNSSSRSWNDERENQKNEQQLAASHMYTQIQSDGQDHLRLNYDYGDDEIDTAYDYEDYGQEASANMEEETEEDDEEEEEEDGDENDANTSMSSGRSNFSKQSCNGIRQGLITKSCVFKEFLEKFVTN